MDHDTGMYEQDKRTKITYIINRQGDVTDMRKSLNLLEHVTFQPT